MRPSFMWYTGCFGVLLALYIQLNIQKRMFPNNFSCEIAFFGGLEVLWLFLKVCKSGVQLGQHGSQQRPGSPRCIQTSSPCCSRSISVVFLSLSDLFQWTRHPPLFRAGSAWLSSIDFHYTRVLSRAHKYSNVFRPNTWIFWCSIITSGLQRWLKLSSYNWSK